MGAHQSRELVAHTREEAQTVVLGQGVEEILDNVALVGAGDFLQLLDDLLLVAGGQGRGAQDGGQLGVLLEGLAQRGQRLGGLLEGRSLRSGGVLYMTNNHRGGGGVNG